MPTSEQIWQMVNQLDSRLKAGFRNFYADNNENKRKVDEAFKLMESDARTTVDDVRMSVECFFKAAPTAAVAEPFTVSFVKGQLKKIKDFPSIPEWSELISCIESEYPEHEVEAYHLKHGRCPLTETNWRAIAAKYQSDKNKDPEKAVKQGPEQQDKPFVVAVISECKAFSSFRESEVFKLLPASPKTVELNDSVFQAEEIDVQDKLDAAVAAATGLQTQGDLLQHVGLELVLRLLYTAPPDHVKESSKRELIGPVLFGVAALAGDVEVIAELSVLGRYAKGSVDYVMMYKDFCIVVAEGKLHPTLQEHFGQLAAEMSAARDKYIHDTLGKRKLEDAELDKVPSYGVLTDGSAWKLYMYDPDAKRLQRCSTLQVSLKRGMDVKHAAAEAVTIIKHLLPIVKSQKKSMEAFNAKRRRTQET